MKKIFSLFAACVFVLAANAQKYYLVGAFNDWKLETAVEFQYVSGVLTAQVANLNGTFKVIQDKAWTNQWATNWDTKAGLEMNVPYEMGAKNGGPDPANLALANPFGGYNNAKLTLSVGEKMVLTLVSGNFYVTTNDWYVPGAWQTTQWKCTDDAKMTAVSGKTNTYELKIAELKGEFKVVYGQWAVEFGSQKDAHEKWALDTEMALAFPCSNMEAPEGAPYQNVILTLVVDYEKVEAKLTIKKEGGAAIDNTTIDAKAIKTFENGQLVIIKNGVRYDATGAVLR